MADYNSLYHQGLYLSPDQQDLLLAALSSNQPPQKQENNKQRSQTKTDADSTPGNMSSGSFTMSPGFNHSHHNSGGLGYGDDESPFLDFNPEIDLDFQGSEDLIGDLPGSQPPSEEYEAGDKRKDMSDNENEESGKKRRESDDKTAKKPGRKPLTSEPTSVCIQSRVVD
jgi:AP-1-like factor